MLIKNTHARAGLVRRRVISTQPRAQPITMAALNSSPLQVGGIKAHNAAIIAAAPVEAIGVASRCSF